MTKLTEGRHEILASTRFHRSCGKGCEEWVPRTLEGGAGLVWALVEDALRKGILNWAFRG